MIKTSRLQFSYKDSNDFDFPEIDLKEQEDLLILGESGVGKSTFIKLLSGLLIPTSGDVTIDNTIVTSLSPAKLDKFRGKNIGMVFQRSHFVKSLSVIENMLLVLYLAGLNKDKSKAIEVLENVGLGGKLNKAVYELSQGEQQRLSIASSLIKEPKLILADEPTSSLDDKNCSIIISLLKEQAKRTSASLIIVTHDRRLKDEFFNVLEL